MEFKFGKFKVFLIFSALVLIALTVFVISIGEAVQVAILSVSFLLILQGLFTVAWMLYAWENPFKTRGRRSPSSYYKPKYSFTALVPMRFEEKVVLDTIKAINNIKYPTNLKEIIIICRHDDAETINKAQEIVAQINDENHMVLVLVDSQPINKPVSLNFGLQHARGQIVAIFDAEDEPHPDIYKIVNTVIQKERVDFVQSGVQLMNFESHWFSLLNVMEYFLWFKSGLHFFTDIGKITFLGGNTVFFKKKYLEKIGGWDETCLTEDADIGIRLTLAGAKARVIYDEKHVTREETPSSVDAFIKQRTRWNQGFLQIILKGDWLKLGKPSQKLIGTYILLAPFFPVLLFLYIPFGIWIGLTRDLSVVLSMVSYIPFYILLIIITIQIVGLWEFTRAYRLKYRWWVPFKVFVTYFPYMALLTYSAVRAFYRFILSFDSWEKTAHLNEHRKMEAFSHAKT